MNEQDELDALIAELAKTPAERDVLLEEHRQRKKIFCGSPTRLRRPTSCRR